MSTHKIPFFNINQRSEGAGGLGMIRGNKIGELE